MTQASTPRACQANQKLARQPPTADEGQVSYLRKPPRLCGGCEDFLWNRGSPFLKEGRLGGDEGRCVEDLDGPGPERALEEDPVYEERLDACDDVDGLMWGWYRDLSRAAERAVSTEDPAKREDVWKNGSASKFLF